MSKRISRSKFISLVLRHKPEAIGITLDENGWANVTDLINGIKREDPSFNMRALEDIVNTDNKQRYTFNEDKTLIRANQGHSVDVDVELTLVESPPAILYHGTSKKAWVSISEQGLKPRSRKYIHLSADLETAMKVALRHSKSDISIIHIDTKKLIDDGHKFYISKNGVYLCDMIPASYIKEAYVNFHINNPNSN